MMTGNIGTTDRMVRVILAVLIVLFFFVSQLSPATAIIMIVVAIYLIVTGLLEFDPIYLVFGVSTKEK